MIKHLTAGEKCPKIVNAIIEIPKDTHNKYEYDEHLDIIKLDRVLHTSMHYPVDYGFIPGTRSEDGDHLDVMVITNSPVFTGCLLEVRPLGAMIMSDEHGNDEKILAVPSRDPYFNHLRKLSDVSPHLLLEIEHFFTEYKRLEMTEEPIVKGWVRRLVSYKVIRQSLKRYRNEEKVSQTDK